MNAMVAAAFDALDEGRPFSSLETRLVRYHGSDFAVVDMQIRQMMEQANARPA